MTGGFKSGAQPTATRVHWNCPGRLQVHRDGRDDHGAGDDVTTRDKTYRCEDYGVSSPPAPRVAIALVFLGIATITALVGIFRGAHFLWKRLLHTPDLVSTQGSNP